MKGRKINLKQLKLSPLISLPNELLFIILTFLNPTDLIAASLICKRFNTLSRENILWEPHCISKQLPPYITSFKEQYKFENNPIVNLRFFSHNNDNKRLTAKCMLIGNYSHSIAFNRCLGKVFSSGKTLDDQYEMDYHHHITGEILRLKLIPFYGDFSSQIFPGALRNKHCIILLIDLEKPDLNVIEKHLSQIQMTEINIFVAICGVYQTTRALTDEGLHDFAKKHKIQTCEVVNFDQPAQVKAAVNTIIEALISAIKARNTQDQQVAPSKKRSKCLTM